MFNIYGHKAYDSSDINNIYVYESIVNLVIIQRPKITVRIQDEVLALRTYNNSYLGADKARSASGRLTARDTPHTESGGLNSHTARDAQHTKF